ncbi:nuclear transport factor 2 family protein [Actinomadura atramentaria]|uniref:nuclear transport factor 2 family protein n=1 Tax=Actinomadura atramentaria TaxID=1990 RepID=UPI00036D5DF4|nr:nuclear transport factor 2 family protein [Actinomadura atramentaria]
MAPVDGTLRQQSPDQIARRYYALVDAQEVDALVALFHPAVRYERQGTPEIVGIDALRRFYEGERVIASGSHHLEQVLADGDWVAVRGRFDGVLRDGERVEVRFTDWWHFDRAGLVDRRESLFPGRSV